jgi:hypothetical protein
LLNETKVNRTTSSKCDTLLDKQLISDSVMSLMNRLVRTLPFSLTIVVLMIGLASFEAQSNLAKATNLPMAVLSFDSKEAKLVRTPPKQWVAKPENINYKELAGDVVNIFKWMEVKNTTLASFLNSFAGRDSDCRSECFFELRSDAESSFSGLKGAKYISHIVFRVHSTSGKDVVPDAVDITIKEAYQSVFLPSLFYQELVGSKVSYEEIFRRISCEEANRKNCPKTRVYSQNIRPKKISNSNTKLLYNVRCYEDITRGKKFSVEISLFSK